MVVECAFGVMSSRFCIFMRRMVLSPEVATTVVKAVCALHNFLAKPNDPLVQSYKAKLNADLDKECEERKG